MPVLVNRRFVIVAGVVAVMAAIGTIRHFDADRSLDRTWHELLSAVEERKASRLRDLLAADYSDRWGYTRDRLVEDARAAFLQFQRLEVQAEQVQLQRNGDLAAITALIRIEADGHDPIANARATINGLFTPFTFAWRRADGFPWSWQLVSFDHPELELRRLQSRARE